MLQFVFGSSSVQAPVMMSDKHCFLPHKFLTCDSFTNVMGMDRRSFTGKGHFIFQESYYIGSELCGAFVWYTLIGQRCPKEFQKQR